MNVNVNKFFKFWKSKVSKLDNQMYAIKFYVKSLKICLQLNIVMGLAQFGVFSQQLETMERMTGGSSGYMFK